MGIVYEEKGEGGPVSVEEEWTPSSKGTREEKRQLVGKWLLESRWAVD